MKLNIYLIDEAGKRMNVKVLALSDAFDFINENPDRNIGIDIMQRSEFEYPSGLVEFPVVAITPFYAKPLAALERSV